MSNNSSIYAYTDAAYIALIGHFIRHHRLEQNKTQLQLAKEAGINRTTLAEFENGRGTNLSTLISLLRALNMLYILESFRVQLQLSPLQLAELEQSKRKRASRVKKQKRKSKSTW